MQNKTRLQKYLIGLFSLILIGCSAVKGIIEYNTTSISANLSIKECKNQYFCGNTTEIKNTTLDIFSFSDSYIVYFNNPIKGSYHASDITFNNISEIPVIEITSTTSEYIEFRITEYFSKEPISIEDLNISYLNLDISYYP